MAKTFVGHFVEIGGTDVLGVGQVTGEFGEGWSTHEGDGTIDDVDFCLTAEDPVGSFQTTDLTALSTCGPNGTHGSSFVLYGAQVGDAAAKLGNGEHVSVTMGTALVYPVDLSVSDPRGDALLSYRAVGYKSDGAVATVVADDANLPSNAASGKRFGIHSITLNTTDVTNVQSLALAFGIQAVTHYGDGHTTPVDARIVRRSPLLTFSTTDLDFAATVGPRGLALTAFTLGLRQRAAGATYYADNTSNHVKLTWAAGVAYPVQASTGRPGTASFAVRLKGAPTVSVGSTL